LDFYKEEHEDGHAKSLAEWGVIVNIFINLSYLQNPWRILNHRHPRVELIQFYDSIGF
jgi:hypothetical protein